ncbi:MAG: hydrogen gas-evolving membrane-bound hydrogenase subunit E [Spirochaetaceae bacterium]
MRRPQRYALLDVIALLVVAGLLALVLAPEPGPAEATEAVRAHVLEEGVEETGATNLVSAIYLNYRAFDTLGETIVLLLAVSGVVYLVGAKR